MIVNKIKKNVLSPVCLSLFALSAVLASTSAISALQPAGNTDGPVVQIVGGDQAQENEFPFMVALTSRNGFQFCGASLINATHVLTAAHCVDGSNPQNIVAVVGAHRLNQVVDSQRIIVEDIIIHPQYNNETSVNDIAVLRLSGSASSSLTPVNIAANSDSTPGTITTVAGWGTTSSGGNASNVLLKVDVPLTTLDECRDAYGRDSIVNSHVCAGFNQGGKDSCQGDSGGPLFIEKGNGFAQVGIVSFGNGCALPGFPGVYTKVSSFSDFIQNVAGSADPGNDDDGGGGNDEPGQLSNGKDINNLSGNLRSEEFFHIDIPQGATNLSIRINGGNGDADLYVSINAIPTENNFDCRPFRNGNNESCSAERAGAGRYNIMIRGFKEYSNMTLAASFNDSSRGFKHIEIGNIRANTLQAD